MKSKRRRKPGAVVIARTSEQHREGLRPFHGSGRTDVTMVFPNSTGNFNTRGMKQPIDIKKVDDQGRVIVDHRGVPPEIDDIFMGDTPGTVIESSTSVQKFKKGGIVKKKRDYKKEYKKFQSSGKMKKYRAKLNKYNRDKGTYGNGDGKDASHKNGGIVGFEDQSKNRGRREKSRIKKKK